MTALQARLPRLLLAALFATSASASVFVTAATHAGSPATGLFAAAPAAALADADDRRWHDNGRHNGWDRDRRNDRNRTAYNGARGWDGRNWNADRNDRDRSDRDRRYDRDTRYAHDRDDHRYDRR